VGAGVQPDDLAGQIGLGNEFPRAAGVGPGGIDEVDRPLARRRVDVGKRRQYAQPAGVEDERRVHKPAVADGDDLARGDVAVSRMDDIVARRERDLRGRVAERDHLPPLAADGIFHGEHRPLDSTRDRLHVFSEPGAEANALTLAIGGAVAEVELRYGAIRRRWCGVTVAAPWRARLLRRRGRVAGPAS